MTQLSDDELRAGHEAPGPQTRNPPTLNAAAPSHEYRIYGPLSEVTGMMLAEFDRAKAKHGDQTPDGTCLPDRLHELLTIREDFDEYAPDVLAALNGYADMRRLATLTEELGEVGRCLTYDQDHAGELKKELIQVAAMALAWARRL